jgi:hypothetical protein
MFLDTPTMIAIMIALLTSITVIFLCIKENIQLRKRIVGLQVALRAERLKK